MHTVLESPEAGHSFGSTAEPCRLPRPRVAAELPGTSVAGLRQASALLFRYQSNLHVCGLIPPEFS